MSNKTMLRVIKGVCFMGVFFLGIKKGSGNEKYRTLCAN